MFPPLPPATQSPPARPPSGLHGTPGLLDLLRNTGREHVSGHDALGGVPHPHPHLGLGGSRHPSPQGAPLSSPSGLPPHLWRSRSADAEGLGASGLAPGLGRQVSVDSFAADHEVRTPAALWPRTPECSSPAVGFMLPPSHCPSGLLAGGLLSTEPTQDIPGPLADLWRQHSAASTAPPQPPVNRFLPYAGQQVVYVPVMLPHKCKRCGYDCCAEPVVTSPGRSVSSSSSSFPSPWLSSKVAPRVGSLSAPATPREAGPEGEPAAR